jgi:hydroxymethylglutaryl-CoA reductase
VHGEHADGEFFVPLATTEGTLVASYNRGMKLLHRAGGVTVTVMDDRMQRAPVFGFDRAREVRDFGHLVTANFDVIKQEAEATTSVGGLLDIEQFSAAATGQDIANVADSSAALVRAELLTSGSYYYSITIPALLVATYGGGTGLPRSASAWSCLAAMAAAKCASSPRSLLPQFCAAKSRWARRWWRTSGSPRTSGSAATGRS